MVPRLTSSLSHIGRWHSLPKGDWSVFPGIWKRTEINFVWQVPHHSFEMLTAFLGIEWKPAFDVDPWDISGFPTRKKEHVKTREFSVCKLLPCWSSAVYGHCCSHWVTSLFNFALSSPSCLPFFFCFVWRQDLARPGGRALVPALGRDKQMDLWEFEPSLIYMLGL